MKLERKYTREEKKELVDACLAREGSINSWCKENKLPSSTFHGWLKKYGTQKESTDFIEVLPIQKSPLKKTAINTNVDTNSTVLVIEYNNFKINLDSTIDTVFLSKVLKAVAETNV